MATIAGKIFQGIGKGIGKFAQSGVGKFLGNTLGSALGSPMGIGGLISLVTGGIKGLKSFGKNVTNTMTQEQLTGAQREANAFNAQQAQVARDYETQMSNTAYQRGVADMQNAGVNPALMYGQGAAPAGTPNGAAADSVSPTAGDPVGMIGMIANLKLLNAQAENIKADTAQKRANTAKIQEETKNIQEEFNLIKANVRGANASADAQETINKFLNEQETYKTEALKWDAKKSRAEYRNTKQELNNLKATELNTLMDTYKKYHEAMLTLKETDLTEEKINEVKATIANINASTNLLGKDAQNYIFNHARQIKVSHSVGASLIKAGFNVSESGEVLVFPEDADKFRRIVQNTKTATPEDKAEAGKLPDDWTNTD